MRLLRYPPKEGLEEREGEREGEGEAVGISAHTDFECFTLIHQSACGLQVLGKYLLVLVHHNQLTLFGLGSWKKEEE